MYLPSHFEETRPAVLQALLRQHPLGLLITQDAVGAPVTNAIPFMLEAGRGEFGTLVGHVARANPVWQAPAKGQTVHPALVVFQGPEGYISPSGYPGKAEHGKVVPTWNYTMVQARGRHEAIQRRPWAVADAPDDYIVAMLRAIVCIEIPLTGLVGKYKLSQNRSAADQAGVVANLQTGSAAASGQVRPPDVATDLARWMLAAGQIRS
jgi:transcriptional regulator